MNFSTAGIRSLLLIALLAIVSTVDAAQEEGDDATAPTDKAPATEIVETQVPGAVEPEVPIAAEPQSPAGPTPLKPAEREQLVEEASRAEATHLAGQDAALSERLRSIFAALDSMSRLQVDVKAGIVVLSGTVSTRDAADSAAEMANALDGVVLVVNEVEVESDMTLRLETSWDKAIGQLKSAVVHMPLVGVSLAILALTWLVARLLRDATFLYRLFSRRLLLQNLISQSVFVAVLLAGTVVTLRFLDAGALIGAALGAAGVVGLALGFAFRGIVENYLAGILLAIRQPFSVRDLVSIDGTLGTVLRMTTSETTLLDADGNHMRLPNATVFNGRVLNYTRNPLRRFTVAVSVGGDVDLAHALMLGSETLGRMNGVVEEPAPSGIVAALGDSAVQLEIYGWVDQRNANYVKAASEANRLVKAAYDQAGIAMPAPAYRVELVAPAPTLSADVQHAASQPHSADSGVAPEQVDLSDDEDVTKQVEEEIERAGEGNLLAEEGREER